MSKELGWETGRDMLLKGPWMALKEGEVISFKCQEDSSGLNEGIDWRVVKEDSENLSENK